MGKNKVIKNVWKKREIVLTHKHTKNKINCTTPGQCTSFTFCYSSTQVWCRGEVNFPKHCLLCSLNSV